jgi:hypothetical protein
MIGKKRLPAAGWSEDEFIAVGNDTSCVIGSSERSTSKGCPLIRSPSRSPNEPLDDRYPVSVLIRHDACPAKVRKVSFSGRSAALPGIPAQYKLRSTYRFNFSRSIERCKARMNMHCATPAISQDRLSTPAHENVPSLPACFL